MIHPVIEHRVAVPDSHKRAHGFVTKRDVAHAGRDPELFEQAEVILASVRQVEQDQRLVCKLRETRLTATATVSV